MNIQSDKFNCYVEGVRIPLYSAKYIVSRDQLSISEVKLPLAEIVDTKAFANALVQITSVVSSKEKLFYEGFCTEYTAEEEQNVITLSLESKWGVLNFNTTLDYLSPKKYGLQNLDEGLRVWVGTETAIDLNSSLFEAGQLSNRYMFLVDETIDEISPSDTESNKLHWVLNRFPFAERIAYSLFEDIAYQNFYLTRAGVERMNLLTKSKTKRTELAETQGEDALLRTAGNEIRIDPKRSGLEGLIQDANHVDKVGCAAPPRLEDNTVYVNNGPKTPVIATPGFTNFDDAFKTDPRSKYVHLRNDRNQHFSTPGFTEFLFRTSEEIFNTYGVKVLIGAISKSNPAGTDFIRTGWGKHNDHRRGTAGDLYIEKASNSTLSDYDYKRAIGCMNIYFKHGATWIGFQDFKRQAELNKACNGRIENIRGHQDHFHVQFIE
jgi:hypothetical protein